jgi:hypothetical protein
MADHSDRSLSRATLLAALIAGVCAILAALIGVSVGHRRADEVVQGLQQDVHSRDQSLDSLNSELAKRDAQISALKASVEEQQRVAAQLQHELTVLKNGSTSSPIETSVDERSGTGSGGNEPKPPAARLTPQRAEQGNFNFELRGCIRRGDMVSCSLAVTNVGGGRRQMNLCGATYLVDDAGRQPHTRVQFDGGACGVQGLEPNLPRAFQMSASIPDDAKKLNVIIHDGNWFSFPGSAIFRDVPIQ